MKNTIFLTSAFTFELLENAEDNLNYIILNFDTSAALNQEIQVVYKSVTYRTQVASSSHIEFEVPSTLWALGGSTAVRLVNDQVTSEYIYLTFPDVLQTDAFLEQQDANHFFMNGQEDIEEKLKMQIITYQNGRAYNITTLQQVCHIGFAAVIEGTQALFNVTINLDIANANNCLVTARIRVNRDFDEVFIPKQSLQNGHHVLTISYPMINVDQGASNQIDLYLQASGGDVTIAQGAILASLIGTGVASSTGFTGLIEAIDTVTNLEVIEIEMEQTTTDSITLETQTPEGIARTDTVANFNYIPLEVESVADSAVIVLARVELARVLEDLETERITENGDYRYTE